MTFIEKLFKAESRVTFRLLSLFSLIWCSPFISTLKILKEDGRESTEGIHVQHTNTDDSCCSYSVIICLHKVKRCWSDQQPHYTWLPAPTDKSHKNTSVCLSLFLPDTFSVSLLDVVVEHNPSGQRSQCISQALLLHTQTLNGFIPAWAHPGVTRALLYKNMLWLEETTWTNLCDLHPGLRLSRFLTCSDFHQSKQNQSDFSII